MVEVAPQVGLEPTACELTVRCSTIELLWNVSKVVAIIAFSKMIFNYVDGLEPSYTASSAIELVRSPLFTQPTATLIGRCGRASR